MTDKVIWILFVILFIIGMLVLSQHPVATHGMQWNNKAVGVVGRD